MESSEQKMSKFEGEVIWKKGDDEDYDEMWDDTALIEAYDKAVSHVKEQIAKRNKGIPDSNGKNSRASSHKRKRRGKANKNKRMWKIGDFCQVVYLEDGQLYEAVIKHIKNQICTVEFVGYGNQQDVYLDDILQSQGKEARIQQTIAAQVYQNNLEQSESKQAEFNYVGESSSSMETNTKHSFLHTCQHKCNTNNKKRQIPHHSWLHQSGQSQYPAPNHQCPNFAPSWPNIFQPSCHHKRNSIPMPPPMPPPPFPIEDGIVNDDEALVSMLMAWYMSGYHTGYYQGLRQSQTSNSIPKCNKNCRCSY